MDLLSASEDALKFAHLVELRKAVRRAEEAGKIGPDGHRHYTHGTALDLQRRKEELKRFLMTMPLRVVQ